MLGFDIFKSIKKGPPEKPRGGPFNSVTVKNLDKQGETQPTEQSLGSPEYTIYTMQDQQEAAKKSVPVDSPGEVRHEDEKPESGKSVSYELKKNDFTSAKRSFVEDFEVIVSVDEKSVDILKELNNIFFEIKESGPLFAESSSKEDLRKALKDAVLGALDGHDFSHIINLVIEKMNQDSAGSSPFLMDLQESKDGSESEKKREVIAGQVSETTSVPKDEKAVEKKQEDVAMEVIVNAPVPEADKIIKEKEAVPAAGQVVDKAAPKFEEVADPSTSELEAKITEFIDDSEKLHGIFGKEVASLLENSKFKKNKATKEEAVKFTKKAEDVLRVWRELLDRFSKNRDKTPEIISEFRGVMESTISLREEIISWDASKNLGEKKEGDHPKNLFESVISKIEKEEKNRIEKIKIEGTKVVKTEIIFSKIGIDIDKFKGDKRRMVIERVRGAEKKIRDAKKEKRKQEKEQERAERMEQDGEQGIDPWSDELMKALLKIKIMTVDEFNKGYEPSQIAEAFSGDYAEKLAEFLHSHEHDSVDQFTSSEKREFEGAIKAAKSINDESNPLEVVVVNGNTYKIRKQKPVAAVVDPIGVSEPEIAGQDFSHMTDAQDVFSGGEKVDEESQADSESEVKEEAEKKERPALPEKITEAFSSYTKVLLKHINEQFSNDSDADGFLGEIERGGERAQFLIKFSDESLRGKIREKEVFLGEKFGYSRENEDALVDHIFDSIFKK